MNLMIQRHLAAALVCGAALLTAAAHGATKNVLSTLKTPFWENDYVQASATMNLGKGPATYSAFFKIDPSKFYNNSTIQYMPIIMGVGSLTLGITSTSDGPQSICFQVRTGNYNYSRFTACDAPTDGKWHHVALTTATGAVSVYLDGEAVYSGTVAHTYSDGKQASKLFVNKGKYGSQSGVFGGSLAEVSVWNRALTADEVAALRAGRPESMALNNGCLAFWPLAGDTKDLMGVYDLSVSSTEVFGFTSSTDFPEYKVGDSRIFVPITRSYPTNLVDVAIGEGASMKDGMFEKDKPVTFTATAKDPSVQFVRWYGDVPEEIATSATIELTADKEKTIVPYFAFDWTFDETAKTITDGYWTIDATVTKGTTSMKTGKAKTGLPLPLLDLAKAVCDTNATSYTITAMGGFESSGGAFEGKTFIQEVVLPPTLSKTESLLHNYWAHGIFKGCTALKKVTPFMPTSFGTIGEQMFFGCTSLEGELTLGGGSDACILSESVTGDGTVYGQQFANTKITGVKVCANVPKLSRSLFNGCSALTNVVFEKEALSEIGQYAFENCKAVASFTLSQRPVIAETAFNGWTSNQCRFVVSAVDSGWSAYMADPANFTPWKDLDEATRAGYAAKFPGAGRPLGLSLTLPKNQWLCNDGSLGMMLLVK